MRRIRCLDPDLEGWKAPTAGASGGIGGGAPSIGVVAVSSGDAFEMGVTRPGAMIFGGIGNCDWRRSSLAFLFFGHCFAARAERS